MSEHTAKKPGSVYFLWHPHAFCKIGHSTNNRMTHRVSTIQIGSPYKLRLLFVIHAKDSKMLEGELHKHFKDTREMNEWFRFESEASLLSQMKKLGFYLHKNKKTNE